MSVAPVMAHLPPTHNTLDREQRRRLVRTNRKLEAVLGISPYLLDDTERPPHSPTSSFSSFESDDDGFIVIEPPPNSSKLRPANHSKSAEPSDRPTLLRMRSASVAADRAGKHSPRHVMSTVEYGSPHSPTFNINLEKKKATRLSTLPPGDPRRKFAKLCRTLGENIPPELVFQPPPPGESQDSGMKPRQKERIPFPTPQHHSHRETIEISSGSRIFNTPPRVPRQPRNSHPFSLSRSRSRSRSHSQPRSRHNSTSAAGPSSAIISPPPRISSKPPIATTSSFTPHLTLAERRRRLRPRSLSLGASFSISVLPKSAPSRPKQAGEASTTPEQSSSIRGTSVPPSPIIQVDVSISSYPEVTEEAVKPSSPPTTAAPVTASTRAPTPNPPLNPKVLEALDALQGEPKSPAPFEWVDGLPPPPPPPHYKLRREHRVSRSESSALASIWLSRPSSAVPRRLLGGAGRRKEREWSGEWNKQDMGEVVRALRGLKAR